MLCSEPCLSKRISLLKQQARRVWVLTMLFAFSFCRKPSKTFFHQTDCIILFAFSPLCSTIHCENYLAGTTSSSSHFTLVPYFSTMASSRVLLFSNEFSLKKKKEANNMACVQARVIISRLALF